MLFRLVNSCLGVLPISAGLNNGPTACSSRLSARASQKNEERKALFHSVGAERFCICPLMPTLRPMASLKPCLGLWQVAQETLLSADKMGSKNNSRPRSVC